jgi:hypothetical protein
MPRCVLKSGWGYRDREESHTCIIPPFLTLDIGMEMGRMNKMLDSLLDKSNTIVVFAADESSWEDTGSFSIRYCFTFAFSNRTCI